MIALQRASLKCGARNPLLFRVPRKQPQLHGRRNVSNKEQSTSPSQRPPHTPNEITIAPKGEVPKTEPVDIPGVAWYRRLGPVSDFFSWFHRTQAKRPLTVQLCTSLTTYLVGDLMAQEIGGEQYDYKRTIRMLLIGSISSIPGYKWCVIPENAIKRW